MYFRRCIQCRGRDQCQKIADLPEVEERRELIKELLASSRGKDTTSLEETSDEALESWLKEKYSFWLGEVTRSELDLTVLWTFVCVTRNGCNGYVRL